jgi:GNAT superfamily N-acetyltransferase
LKDLLPLYRDVFRKNVPLGYFSRKFDTKSFGAEFTGFIAYGPGGQPAAYYGLFPCLVKFGERIVLSATSGDTMTHSAHRGKGLFMQLASRTYELAREQGIEFAYGFPNQDSLKGSVKLGWKYEGDHLRFYSMKINTLPLAKIKRRLVGSDLPSQIDPGIFPNSLQDHCVLHDERYGRYKSYSRKKIVSIAGSKAWLKVDGVLKVGDIEPSPGFKMDSFLAGLRNFCFFRAISEVQFLTGRDTWLDKDLSQHLNGAEAFPVGHFHFDTGGMDLQLMKYNMCDLDTF